MKINNDRVKYIFAREGLILLAFISIAVVIGWINKYKTNTFRSYNSLSVEYELMKPSKEKALYGKYFEILGKTVYFPAGTDNAIIDNTTRRDFGGDVELMTHDDAIQKKKDLPLFYSGDVVRRYNANGETLFNGIIWKIDTKFLFNIFISIGYPIYLVGRFVIWAVNTIKINRK